jgi:hypothetical protein
MDLFLNLQKKDKFTDNSILLIRPIEFEKVHPQIFNQSGLDRK